MTIDSTRWRVPPAAWIWIGAAIGAESISNGLRAYGLGSHLDRFTVHVAGAEVSLAGAVLVLAAAAVSMSQARAAWLALTPGTPTGQRVVAAVTGILLLAISMTAMASHILEAERAKTSAEGKGRSDYDRIKAAYDKAAAELATLDATRTTTEVRQAMDATRVPLSIWTSTRQCTDADLLKGRINNDACKPVLDLRQEMARAIRKAEIEPEVRRLSNELARSVRPEATSASEAVLAGAWGWLMGSGVVLLATFGAVIFATRRPHGTDPVAIPGCTMTDGATDDRGGQSTDGTPQPDGYPGDRSPWSREQVAQYVVTEIALGRSVPSQMALAAVSGRPKQTISDWLRRMETDGVIPPRTVSGRMKVIG